MGKFKKYLKEIKKSELLKNTDTGRIERGTKEMRVRPPKVTVLDNGYERYDYNFKSSPPDKSVEGKNHRGYVIINPKNGIIKRIHCDCLDWHYRLWKPYVKVNLDSFKLTPMEQKRQSRKHNKADTIITNPDESKFLCKHLTALFRNYLTDIPRNKE